MRDFGWDTFDEDTDLKEQQFFDDFVVFFKF